MPAHEWSRVEAGIFHDFHHAWIEEIKRTLNSGLLPDDYYALAEQFASGYGPDVLTLERPLDGALEDVRLAVSSNGGTTTLLAPPKARPIAETDMEFYRRKQSHISVRHISGDRVVAVVEVVSPGNKSGRRALRDFVEKAAELIDRRVHLLLLDLIRPTSRDPNGIHGVIWEEITGDEYQAPQDKPFTLASYESALAVRAYVERFAVGEDLPEMPLFLEPGACVHVPLAATYETAFSFVPRRWQRVLEASS